MARRTVLIVSSVAHRLTALQETVHQAGFLPLSAETVGHALSLLGKVRPALILMDTVLSDGSGPELLRALRALPLMERVPVVVLGATAGTWHEPHDDDPYLAILTQEGADLSALDTVVRETLDRLAPSL